MEGDGAQRHPNRRDAVSWLENQIKMKKFRASIIRNKKTVCLGRFDTKEEVELVRLSYINGTHPKSPKNIVQGFLTCPCCKELKPESEFVESNAIKISHTKPRRCKECYKIWYRKQNWSANYGLSEDEWTIMFDKQNGCCAICRRHQSEFKIRLCVDHDHSTGKIRKLRKFTALFY